MKNTDVTKFLNSLNKAVKDWKVSVRDTFDDNEAWHFFHKTSKKWCIDNQKEIGQLESMGFNKSFCRFVIDNIRRDIEQG